MDTVRRRRCETCASHEPGPTPCTGRCRNLEWQPRADAIRFVRDRELGCYRGWGVDSWQPKNHPGMTGGPGGAGAGSGGSGSGGPHPYGTLSGSPLIPPIPVELLEDVERQNGRDLDPEDRRSLAD